MEKVEVQSNIEFSTDLRDRALNTANNFLNSPDAASIKEESFLSTKLENQTILKTHDETSNTAFHVESCYAAGSLDPNAKKTVISWLTLGDEKGEFPSGTIEILESGGKKQILAYKHDRNLFTDEGYLWGGSRDMVDRTSDMETGDNRILLNEEQVSQILARLESSQANKEHTEATARIMDSENRFSEALVEFQDAQSTRGFDRSSKFATDRKKLLDVLLEAALKYREAENYIVEKRKNSLK